MDNSNNIEWACVSKLVYWLALQPIISFMLPLFWYWKTVLSWSFFVSVVRQPVLCEYFKSLHGTYGSSAHHCCLDSHWHHHTQPSKVYNDSLSCRRTQCLHHTYDQDPLWKMSRSHTLVVCSICFCIETVLACRFSQQISSSSLLPSAQSCTPSQCQEIGIQCLFLHWNWFSEQQWSPGL